jgi:hypothetical protein
MDERDETVDRFRFAGLGPHVRERARFFSRFFSRIFSRSSFAVSIAKVFLPKTTLSPESDRRVIKRVDLNEKVHWLRFCVLVGHVRDIVYMPTLLSPYARFCVHRVPQYRPVQALAMFERFITGQVRKRHFCAIYI